MTTDFDDELVKTMRLIATNRFQLWAALLVGAIFTTACGSDEGMGTTVLDPGAPASIALSAPTDTFTSQGDIRTVTAVVRNASGSTIASPSLQWTTSAPNIASVVADAGSATVTAMGDGTATITATSGQIHSSISVVVRRKLVSVSVTAPFSTLVVGNSMQLIVKPLDARLRGMDGPSITFSSSDTSNVVVSPIGVVTSIFSFISAPATITATATHNGITASGAILISPTAPAIFDHEALMLSYGQPAVPTFGAGVAYFSVVGNIINYRVSWSMMSGKATAVHLHGAAANVAEVAGTLVDFVAPVATTNFGSVAGSFTAADIRAQGSQPAISLDSLVKLLNTGNAYVDVHTAIFPGGEIRGQTINTPH
ncbi:MAG: CHRD domain-containing protein [Gemmatimonadaceae bacterium]